MLLRIDCPSPTTGESYDTISTLRIHQKYFSNKKIPVFPMNPAATEPKAEPHKTRDIAEPHPHDVLCGRGASISNFVGNLRWRELVKEKKEEYVKLHKLQRHVLSESIVYAVRQLDPPGRFLQRDVDTGLWSDIGDQKANEKTAQALREGAPKLRRKLAASIKKKSEQQQQEASCRKKKAPVVVANKRVSTTTSQQSSSCLFDLAANKAAASACKEGPELQATFRSVAIASRLEQQSMQYSMRQGISEFEPLPLELGQMFPLSASNLPANTTRTEPSLPLPPSLLFPGYPSSSSASTTTTEQLSYRQQQQQQQQQQQTPMVYNHHSWQAMSMMENKFPLNPPPPPTQQQQQQHYSSANLSKSDDSIFVHPSRKVDMGFETRNPLSVDHDSRDGLLMEPPNNDFDDDDDDDDDDDSAASFLSYDADADEGLFAAAGKSGTADDDGDDIHEQAGRDHFNKRAFV